jgi:hypothetical protein
LGGSSGDHHRFIVELMEQGELDWKSIDGWLRANVESETFGVDSDFAIPSRDECLTGHGARVESDMS